MDAEKFKKLQEKLYNETPLIGDRIRQQAAKELILERNPQTIKLLTKALVFSKDKNLQNLILSTLRNIKIQEKELVDVVCQVWAQNRDLELSKLLKLKAWVASKPLELRLITALNLGWQGIIDEQGSVIIASLLSFFHDEDIFIQQTAKEWASNFKAVELQEEVCRLASEENNQDALEVATRCGYTPSEPSQGALFCYFTQQWDKYQELDPQYQLLAQIYDNATEELKKRIDDHGKVYKRLEWLWMRLGGKEGTRVSMINLSEWETIIDVLVNGKHWGTLWFLIKFTPVVFAKTIVKRLENIRWNNSEEKTKFNEYSKIVKNLKSKTPPQGKLIRCIHTLYGHTQSIKDIIVTPDSKTLISIGDEIIRLWDIREGKLIHNLKGHLKGVTSICLSQDGTILTSGSRDKTISIWRLPDGNLLGNLSANVASVWSLAMTNDAKMIASASHQEVRLWQYPPGRLYKNLRGHQREVEKVIISDDGGLLISAGGKKDNTIRVYSLPSGDHQYTLTGHQDGIWDLAISPDNQILATASQDHTIKLWSLSNGTEIATLDDHKDKIWCLAITPDGKTLVTGSEDNTVKLWLLSTGELNKTLIGHEDAIFCLNISHDGQLLATGSKDNTVRLWNLNTGENVGVLTGHQDTITTIKITADGETLITGSGDRTLKLWRWDLSRLCHISVSMITQEDQEWIKNALISDNITTGERSWLLLLEKVIEFGQQ
ncbi:high-affnity carbon uptake protein Hat/HatR [Geminocystis sp. NIES-3708]|uniref:WD40 repeat domain-containing protein n=1 Tax=Geminocystis sp. NIES-3708 TaxID=1615909 RepID=UPI0005FCA381|nr:WD40 repeat domain-containing protein [Geminocystis sp. NIES-3708]BAQ61710.1 high-affnity carbon uptake protein Hat/HatR [Geminocystis sp. NIES-3708]